MNSAKYTSGLFLVLAAAAGIARGAPERAGYDSRGRIIALLSEGGEYDLGFMRKLQDKGIPYVISIWRLPERFYADPATEPTGARGRAVNPAKWDELAALPTDYLLYAKKEDGVEPDLFSFNEGNLGVNVRLTPDEHTLQIKKFGAAFCKAGLKTRMLLGDAVPARDSHAFALDAAADPEALQYAGAVAFHSWGGATPGQYAAWKN